MAPQDHNDNSPETTPAEASATQPVALLAPPATAEISDEEFNDVVSGALESVGGTLLFKVKVVEGPAALHVAAAVVGLGDSRQFLLLSLPVLGGQLKVETITRSNSPLAGIAESYAGLMDVLKVAA